MKKKQPNPFLYLVTSKNVNNTHLCFSSSSMAISLSKALRQIYVKPEIKHTDDQQGLMSVRNKIRKEFVTIMLMIVFVSFVLKMMSSLFCNYTAYKES